MWMSLPFPSACPADRCVQILNIQRARKFRVELDGGHVSIACVDLACEARRSSIEPTDLLRLVPPPQNATSNGYSLRSMLDDGIASSTRDVIGMCRDHRDTMMVKVGTAAPLNCSHCYCSIHLGTYICAVRQHDDPLPLRVPHLPPPPHHLSPLPLSSSPSAACPAIRSVKYHASRDRTTQHPQQQRHATRTYFGQ
jgi:hypothetical protein